MGLSLYSTSLRYPDWTVEPGQCELGQCHCGRVGAAKAVSFFHGRLVYGPLSGPTRGLWKHCLNTTKSHTL